METKKQVFLSYSSKDKERVQPLIESLESEGFDFWWDQEIPIGQTYDSVIEQRLENAKAVLVVWSKHSITSNWVKAEAAVARDQSKMIPVLIDDVKIPLGFSRLQTAKLINWQKDQANETYDQVVAEINRMLAGREPIGQDPPGKKKSLAPYFASGFVIAGLVLAFFVWNQSSKKEPEKIVEVPPVKIDTSSKEIIPPSDGSLTDVSLDGSSSIKEEPKKEKDATVKMIAKTLRLNHSEYLKLKGVWQHEVTMFGKETSDMKEIYPILTFNDDQTFELSSPNKSFFKKKGNYSIEDGFLVLDVDGKLYTKYKLRKLTKNELHLGTLSKSTGIISSSVKQFQKIE